VYKDSYYELMLVEADSLNGFGNKTESQETEGYLGNISDEYLPVEDKGRKAVRNDFDILARIK
jgi:hypothetical protein